jgi:hypothetical protein
MYIYMNTCIYIYVCIHTYIYVLTADRRTGSLVSWKVVIPVTVISGISVTFALISRAIYISCDTDARYHGDRYYHLSRDDRASMSVCTYVYTHVCIMSAYI